MILIDWIFGAILLIFLLSIPVGAVISIITIIIDILITIKCKDLVIQYRYRGGSCWGMKGCGNDTCRLRHFCEVYRNAVTPETVAEMERLLKERREALDRGEPKSTVS